MNQKTNKNHTLSTLIEEARAQERFVVDALLSTDRFRFNPDMSISSLSVAGEADPNKPRLTAVSARAEQQLARRFDMPGQCFANIREHNGNDALASLLNARRQANDPHACKFRLWMENAQEPKFFAAVSEQYASFKNAFVLNLLREELGEWTKDNPGNLSVGLGGSMGGSFGQTRNNPWDLWAFLDLSELVPHTIDSSSDPHKLGIVISQRNDGGGSLKIQAGSIRMACANGCVWGDGIEAFSVVHKGRNAERKLRRKIREAVAHIVSDLPSRFASYQNLKTIILPNPAGALTYLAEKSVGKKRVKQIRQDELSRYIAEMGNTAYAVVNALTDRATQDPSADLREEFAGLAGRISLLSADRWLQASERGQELLANR